MNDRQGAPPERYTAQQGGAALGARLRRLSDRIDREAAGLYAELGIHFEQRWFGVLNLLSLYGPLSVGELTAPLGISHASVSQTRQSLEKAGLIVMTPDPTDARSRKISLSPDGEALLVQTRPLWSALIAVAADLDAEAGEVVAALDRLDQALDQRSVGERVRARLAGAGHTP